MDASSEGRKGEGGRRNVNTLPHRTAVRLFVAVPSSLRFASLTNRRNANLAFAIAQGQEGLQREGDRVAQDDKMAQQGKVGELNSLKTQRYAAAAAGGHFNRIMHEDGRKYFMK